METYIIDTNVFIDHSDILADYPNTIFSIIVLKELDELKYHQNIGYSARSAIRSIRQFVIDHDDYVFDTNQDNTISNDMNIILCAKRHDCTLLTKDIGMSLLAESFSVKCEIKEDKKGSNYTSYIEDSDPEFAFETLDLEGKSLKKFKEYLRWKFDRELYAWDFYITPHDIFCYNPKKKLLECISKNQKYCSINVEDSVQFKPRDFYQKAAVYSIYNNDATLLFGSWGTGKSIVATATALAIAKDRKVFILRPTISSKRYDIGFMPGDKKEKLYQFFSGFMSALATLYGNTRTIKSGRKGVDYDFIKEDLSQEKFEFLTMPELHGLSVQSGDIIIVDEAQLLDIEYTSLLISRIGDGAKLVIMGDMNQTVNLLKNSESGLKKLMNSLPHPAISTVGLRTVYRNKQLCKLADDLMK